MARVGTLYTDYQELLLDIDILGTILSAPQINKEELRVLMQDEFKKKYPIPTLEDARYELSRLVSSDFQVNYNSELELREDEHLVDLSEQHDIISIDTYKGTLADVPDEIKNEYLNSDITDETRFSLISKLGYLDDIEEFSGNIDDVESIYNTVVNDDVINEDDSDDDYYDEDDYDCYSDDDTDEDDYSSEDNTEEDDYDYSSEDNTEEDDYDYSSEDDTDEDDYSHEDDDSDDYDYSSEGNYDYSSEDDYSDDSYSDSEDEVTDTNSDDVISPNTSSEDIVDFSNNSVVQENYEPELGKIEDKEVVVPNIILPSNNTVKKEVEYKREEEPTNIIEFLRKHPNSDVSYVLKYFSKKEIQNNLISGRIIKKGNKVRI